MLFEISIIPPEKFKLNISKIIYLSKISTNGSVDYFEENEGEGKGDETANPWA